MDWSGTWLQSAWLSLPSQRHLWPRLVDAWAESSVFDRGWAVLLEQDAMRLTFDSAQDPSYLPELQWDGDRRVLIDSLRRYAPSRIEVNLGPDQPIPEARVDAIVNVDESLSLHLSTPLSLFADAEPVLGARRFDEFLRLSFELFVPDVMFAGTVGEEAHVSSRESLFRDLPRWTGRGFYGTELASALLGLEDPLRPSTTIWQAVKRDGLFVSWAPWPEWKGAPELWQETMRRLLGSRN